jgi:hypothetical protein
VYVGEYMYVYNLLFTINLSAVCGTKYLLLVAFYVNERLG